MQIALHVDKELLSACLIEVQLLLKPGDEFRMFVGIHGFQQLRLLEGLLVKGLQGTTPFRFATKALVYEVFYLIEKGTGYMALLSIVQKEK